MALLSVTLLLLSGCAGEDSGFRTYRDPEQRFLFRIPADWHLYEDGSVERTPFFPQVDAVQAVPFDGFPVPGPENFQRPLSTASHPLGTAAFRPIRQDERDYVSRFVLTQMVVPYQRQEEVQELLKEDVELGNDFEGVQVLVQFREPQTNQLAAVFLQSVTNTDDTALYSIAVGCSVECFQEHRQEITEVVSSWIVNTRQ